MKKKWLKILIGLSIGAGLGYAYYYFIGCSGGHCPISSNPVISTAYGALIGFLFVFNPRKSKP